MTRNSEREGEPTLPEENDPERDAELVGLEKTDPEADPAEVALAAGTDPELDSPGDDAILGQEELLEGMSSESMPSGKFRKDREASGA